jgi:spermidine synthase
MSNLTPSTGGIPLGRIRVAFWLLTVTLTGAAIMGLELVAFRLYAPYFGYSVYVWGSMISVVMLALAGGYALGGCVADRSHSDVSLYALIMGSAVYQLVIILLVHSILFALWQKGEFAGPVMATLIIYAFPMMALAGTAPFVIRMVARESHVGSVAGMVYAISTAGGIAGTLLTSFWLLPWLGTMATLRVLCGVCFAVGILGLGWRFLVAWLGIPVLLWLFLVPKPAMVEGEVWRADSPYNLLRVVRHENLIWLVLNDARYFHTIRNLNGVWTGYFHDLFATGPLLVPGRSLLVLGMGGGGTIASTRAVAPDIQVDGVEIDPKVVEAGVLFFGLKPDNRNLRVHVVDARRWLQCDPKRYAIVHIDLYYGGPYTPFYVATVEFYRLVREHVNDDGIVMLNLYDTSKDRELLQCTVATLRQAFPSVMVVRREDGSNIVLAFPQERSAASVRAKLQAVEGPEQLRRIAQYAAQNVMDVVPPPGTPVFTDDWAPVEEMTRRMLLHSGS